MVKVCNSACIKWWWLYFVQFSWQMFGHVGWLFMLCWLELTLLKIKMILRILGKQFRWFPSLLQEIYYITFPYAIHFLLLQRIMAVQYKIPDYVHISQDCRHLLSRIFVASPYRVSTVLLWNFLNFISNYCNLTVSW